MKVLLRFLPLWLLGIIPFLSTAQEVSIKSIKVDKYPKVQLEVAAPKPLSEYHIVALEDEDTLTDVLISKVDGKQLVSYETEQPRDGESHMVTLWVEDQRVSAQFSSPPLYSIYSFLKLLGALGLFLFGMKFMSEGIQKAAGSRLRDVLGLMTSNRFLGVFTGFLVTAIIQSSSATTVMVVSFTNAGLFNLSQSIGVIMGANIGTTVTGWIVNTLGLDVSVATYSLPILGLAFPFLFFSNDRLKNWAEFFIGFALLFIGLDELKSSVPDIKNNPSVLEFLKGWTDMGFGSILIFIMVGTLLTIIVQSSSASMALTLVLMSQGWIDFATGAALILGENIGTTITAQLAALVANVEAKRAAMAHTFFNITGIIWVIILFSPFIDMVSYILEFMGYKDVDLANASQQELKGTVGSTGLAIFHTTFNIFNMALLIWFVPYIEKLVRLAVPATNKLGDAFNLRYINSGVMSTPELALYEAKKEIKEFGHLTFKMFRYVEMLMFKNAEKHKKIMKRITKFEEECDHEEIELARYLASVSTQNLSNAASKEIRSMWTMINELERIGDIAYRLAQIIERRIKMHVALSEETEQGLQELFELVEESYDYMLRNLGSENHPVVPFEEIRDIETRINEKRSELRNTEFIQIENDSISFQNGLVAIEIISNLEKIADHIYNVNQACHGIK